jgi:uncharacterized repeat protein (TIGR01451 family)
VTLLALLVALVLGRAPKAAHAGPPAAEASLVPPQQEGCYEPGNLAPNPGFECDGPSATEPADWEPDTYKGKPAVFYRSQLTSHGEEYSVAIASGAESSESRWQSIPISARENWVYEFSSWVNGDNLSNKATVALSFWSDLPSPSTHLGTVTHNGTGNTAGEWVNLVESHKAPTGTHYIRLECHLLGAGTAYFDDVAIREYAQEPVLDLAQLDVPDPVRPGDSLRYTLTLSNTGNVTATNIVISDTFDLNVDFAGDAIPSPDGGSGQVWFWTVPSMTVDAVHQIAITATVHAPLPDRTVLHNLVQWHSDETAPEEEVETTLVRNRPILSIVKTDHPDPVIAGERLTYTIAYTNSGTAPMTNILILEDYPPQTSFLSATPLPSSTLENRLWEMPDLPPGQSDAITIVLSTSVSASGEIINTALFDSNEFSLVPVTETTTINGTKPPYLMRFSPEEAEVRVQVDQPRTKSYDLKNTGSQTLTNILVEAGRPDNWQGGIWVEPTHISSLAPDQSVLINLNVEPAASEISGTYSIPITASDTADPAYAKATVVVGQHAEVQVEPDYKHHARRGETVLPVHQVTNLGNFTDTILVTVRSTKSWPVTPTHITLNSVGIGEMRPISLAITVPHEAPIYFESEVILSATSAMSPHPELAYDVVIVSPWEVYLPVVRRPYVSTDPFCNGDFSSELSPCWTYTTDPPVARSCDSGSCFARLGTPDNNEACEGGLTPNTAVLTQVFVPSETRPATLSFEYTVHTQDVLSDLYDTLELYVDNIRVFSVVAENLTYSCELDPKVVADSRSIPLSLVRDEPIKLEFRLINRDTWFNTYAEIRNVQITY